MAEDMMMVWARVDTAAQLMERINTAPDDQQFGFRLHGSVSAENYMVARNYVIVSNIMRERGDFIRNPRTPPYAPAPTIVVGTLNAFQQSLQLHGINGFVVQFPAWVQPIQAVWIRHAAAQADVDVVDGVVMN